jgi:DNA-binding response OmpR family regulator
MLVVEDDPGNRDVLALAFRSEGFAVASVASGKDAIVRAKETPPAVVVLDLLLPDLDPLAIVEGVRRAGTDPVVVVVSAAPNVRERSREVGADAFFEKPYDLRELIETVDQLVPRPVKPRTQADRAKDR